MIRIYENQAGKFSVNEFGAFHADDGEPAIVYSNGAKYYFKMGRLHNDNGPAIVTRIGSEMWYYYGFQHRTNGPAVVYKSKPNCVPHVRWFLCGRQFASQDAYFRALKKLKKQGPEFLFTGEIAMRLKTLNINIKWS